MIFGAVKHGNKLHPNIYPAVRQRRKRQINIAFSTYSGSDERCGDSCGWARLSDGRFAAAVSDGMGKGEAAARESERAVNSVLPLLKAGMDPEMALQVLNLLWSLSNRKELFPTMDLALLDPASQELKIYKIGAAPTVVIRAPRCWPGRRNASACGGWINISAAPDATAAVPPENIEILTAPALPMGVSECSEIPCISTLVMPGDRILMMTDGILDSRRDDQDLVWLRRLLGSIKSRNLQTVCDLIIREAAFNYSDCEKDDMTVILFEVERC